jgi:hypothetical protein
MEAGLEDAGDIRTFKGIRSDLKKEIRSLEDRADALGAWIAEETGEPVEDDED